MTDDARDDDVILELAHTEHDQAGEERHVPALRQADTDGEGAGGERPDHRHDLDDTGEGADQEPVRQSDQEEARRQQHCDEHDQQQ